MKKHLLFENSFILKLIAILTMTLDHVGVFVATSQFSILRIIGRIALPIFVFLAVEGSRKTSNPSKYILRMGITAFLVAVALIFLSYFMPGGKIIAYSSGNIFIDLLLIILIIRILESKNKKLYPILILPIAYSIFSYAVTKIEGCGCHGYLEFLPPAIRMQYGFYSILLAFGFYFSRQIAELFLKTFAQKASAPEETFLDTKTLQIAQNIISFFVVILSTIILYLISHAFGEAYAGPLDEIQLYAMFSGVFLLFYNGERGYNAKWFKYACYAYYPLHILIIGAIFLL